VYNFDHKPISEWHRNWGYLVDDLALPMLFSEYGSVDCKPGYDFEKVQWGIPYQIPMHRRLSLTS